MAHSKVNRLLYSQQTCIISTGGLIVETGQLQSPPVSNDVWQYQNNTTQAVKDAKNLGTYGDGSSTLTARNTNGFTETRNWLLPVQSASVDETIPQEDVLVIGKLGAAARIQKDVATSKCTVKAYLADYMRWADTGVMRDAGVLDWTAMQYNNATPPALAEAVDATGGLGHMGYNAASSSTAAGEDIDFSKSAPGSIISEDPVVGVDTTAGHGQNYSGSEKGPFPGITNKGYLAGEAWVQNGHLDYARQGFLEQLIWESMGGYEAVIQLFAPSTHSNDESTADGFTFLGILSSISIDVSKGAYPTLDLSFEGVGQVQYLAMDAHDFDSGASDTALALLNVTNSGDWYVDRCTPHTSDDVAIWGRAQQFNTTTGASTADTMTLIAGSALNYYLSDEQVAGTGGANPLSQYGVDVQNFVGSGENPASRVGDAVLNNSLLAGLEQGNVDTLSSAKMSFDMPTETLSALGQKIEGDSIQVRRGNATFSKPPYKASMNLDGQGLKMAGTEKVVTNSAGDQVVEELILPNEIHLGQLHCVLDKTNCAVSSRSINQNVGDVGAAYTVAVEGTMASFRSNYQNHKRDIL